MIARVTAATVLATGLVFAAGCSSSDSGSGETTTAAAATTAGGEVTGEITVFAAASLNSTFTELGKSFESEYPGSTVKFNFAGSSDLVTQLSQGAPGDVFASANTANMDKAVADDLVASEPVDFASNVLTIVTAPGNPKGITGFADLADPGTTVVICAEQVPCGAATKTIEENTGVTLNPVSEESSVTDVLGKVTSGQADAGLVYVTDAKVAGDQVTEVTFPESSAAVNIYPIAVLGESKNPAAAQAFLDLVTGPEGQQVLSEAGFAPAP